MTDYLVREGAPGDFDSMREAIAAAIHPALVVPGFDAAFHAETENIVASVEAAFRQAVLGLRQHVFVGTRREDRCGFLILDCRDGRPQIHWIVVLPDHLGTGLAQLMMAQAIRSLGLGGEIGLVVTQYNHRALRFFKSQGFVPAPGGASASRVMRMVRAPTERELNL